MLEQRELAEQRQDNESKKKEHHDRYFNIDGSKKVQRRDGFDELPENPEDVRQCNEGGNDFRIDESEDGSAMVLELQVGKYMDTSLMDVDVQTRVVRVLIKGKLLQLTLHEEVKPDASKAERSKLTGALVVTMPKANWTKQARGLRSMKDSDYELTVGLRNQLL